MDLRSVNNKWEDYWKCLAAVESKAVTRNKYIALGIEDESDFEQAYIVCRDRIEKAIALLGEITDELEGK